ncbi:MAG: biotin--[acetyl-CoA-carboxylase] ligase [Planctomycetota bacterium]
MITETQARTAQQSLAGGWIRAVRWSESLGSTSTEAMAIARDRSAPDSGLLVVAQRQTAGRGRGTNTWFSDEGSLTFSLLTPRLSLDHETLPRAALAVGVALCEACDDAAAGSGVGLKWPNDLYAEGKKLGGILIESPGFRPARLVVGVGLNVTTSVDQIPAAARSRATSLAAQTQGEIDPVALLVAVAQGIERRLTGLIGGEPDVVRQWQRRSVLGGRHVALETPEGRVRGVCREIDAKGRLVLETPRGTERFVSGSVVSFV